MSPQDPYQSPAYEPTPRLERELPSRPVVRWTILGLAAIGAVVGTVVGVLIGARFDPRGALLVPAVEWTLGGFLGGLALGTAVGIFALWRTKRAARSNPLADYRRDGE